MFAKVFSSLYDGSLRGRTYEILVFVNLLTRADKDGDVDRNVLAVAQDVGITEEQCEAAIKVLESPDPKSRSHENEGRRIVRLDPHRDWGWHIVNYAKYRSIRNSEDRKDQVNAAVRRHRAKKKKDPEK